jgi:hypothetical protein
MTTPLRNDFDEFLFSSIGVDASGAPVSMLTVLARLDVDAWEEAANLARMPRESATQRLASLLASVPNSPAPAESATVATRLVALLHRKPTPAPRAAAPLPPSDPPVHARKSNPAIYYFIGLITLSALIVFVVWRWAAANTQQPVPSVTASHLHG